ncbi:EpsG family protein [Candidatus Saccharibacteria bacterium]|nr:EpsG family protein [Candidatus Saccharibacteria bacterium]
MIIYLIVFAISLALIFEGLKNGKKKKLLSVFLIAAGIILPCLLAAFRNVSIGTDTNGYVSGLFNIAMQTDDLGEYYDSARTWYGISDFIYLTVNFLAAHLFGSFSVFLFVVELLIILPIFFALKKYGKTNNVILLGLGLFFLFEYNVSFNMTRQCLALSFVILMVSLLYEKKYWWATLSAFVAFGFHSTACVTFLMIPIFMLLRNIGKKGRRFLLLCLCVLLAVFVLSLESIVTILYETGIYEHGMTFLQVYSTADYNFNIVDTITYLFTLVIYWICRDYDDESGERYFENLLGIGSIILLSAGWNVKYMERVSLYLFYPFLLYIIPKVIALNSKKTQAKRELLHKNKFALMLVGYFILYWFISFGVMNLHQTVPYEFTEIGVIV